MLAEKYPAEVAWYLAKYQAWRYSATHYMDRSRIAEIFMEGARHELYLRWQRHNHPPYAGGEWQGYPQKFWDDISRL
jgi:hypothetical protein